MCSQFIIYIYLLYLGWMRKILIGTLCSKYAFRWGPQLTSSYDSSWRLLLNASGSLILIIIPSAELSGSEFTNVLPLFKNTIDWRARNWIPQHSIAIWINNVIRHQGLCHEVIEFLFIYAMIHCHWKDI